MRSLVVVFLFLLTLAVVSLAHAEVLHTYTPLTITSIVPAPEQSKLFLRREPVFAEKLKKSKSLGLLHYTPELGAMLEQVNTEGNGAIKWTSDPVAWGEADNWDFPCEVDHKLYDDCDSYTLWKTRRLMELGLPSTPLLFTLVYDETNGYHAILTVATDAGDFVLDNRQAHVMTPAQLIAKGYMFEKRVGVGDDFAGQWINFKPTRKIPWSLYIPAPIPPVPMCHDRLPK